MLLCGTAGWSPRFACHSQKHFLAHCVGKRTTASLTGPFPCLHSQDAVDIVREIPDPEKAAKRLAQEAYDRGSNDNITVLVVRFKH